ncbi:MAG: DMT family transporter [Elusimicrobia bacterium]|nr:DMT family transporter [Elusimicrobiota bacterium]
MKFHAVLVLISFFFGSFYVVGKVTLRDVPPAFLALVRAAGAASMLHLAARWRGGGRVAGGLPDYARLALYAFFGIVVNQLFFLEGLTRTTATSASILITSIPVLTVAFALLLGSERVSARRLCGIGLALAGVLWLTGAGAADVNPGLYALAGNVMILINCASYSLYLVLSRPMTERMDPLSMMAWIFTFGFIGILPLGLASALHMNFAAVPARAWAGVAYAVVFPTMLGYWLNLWALKHVEATTVASYTYLQPVWAAALAWLFLGERLTAHDAAAAALVFAGVYLAGMSPNIAPA